MPTTTPTPVALSTSALEALVLEAQSIPDEVDGINLTQNRQEAVIRLQQAITSVKVLRKLSV